MMLLVVGLGTVAYSVSLMMSDILSINSESRRRNKMKNRISELRGHTIVCGYGRMGKIIVTELDHTNDQKFVIIEKDPLKIKQLEQSKYFYIEGDATHDAALLLAGVKEAKNLVSMIDNDSDALYLTIAARSFKSDLQIIVRANEEESKVKMIRAGANKVILPILISGLKIAQSIINPDIEDYLDLSGVNSNHNQQLYQLSDIHIFRGSKLVGKKIIECNLGNRGIIVVGIKKRDNHFVFAPPLDYQLQLGDTLLALGTEQSCASILNSNN
jgi:voltage-gated potassium channel